VVEIVSRRPQGKRIQIMEALPSKALTFWLQNTTMRETFVQHVFLKYAAFTLQEAL